MSCGVAAHNRVVITICEHIVSQRSIAIIQLRIRIYKPAYLRIIIPGLEIVELSLAVVVIAPVADGVDGGHSARGEDELAPGIVGIGGVYIACWRRKLVLNRFPPRF